MDDKLKSSRINHKIKKFRLLMHLLDNIDRITMKSSGINNSDNSQIVRWLYMRSDELVKDSWTKAMDVPLVLKLLHVFTAFWFTIGIVGRNVVLAKARNCADIREVNTLLSITGIFEKNMVIPGSFGVLLVGIITAWSEGWPILGFIQGGTKNWVLVSLILFLTTIPLVIFVFTPKGKVFGTALKDATAQGRVTPELRSAFHDPVVDAAHTYEIIIIIVIITFMVTKPF